MLLSLLDPDPDQLVRGMDPDPLVRGMDPDPDPFIIMQKLKDDENVPGTFKK
jgi:hypothetical protein